MVIVQAEKPSIIVLSSHVAHGAVGNRIMVPVLERMGFDVIAAATVTLPWHPGMASRFGAPSRSLPTAGDFAALLADLARAAPALNVAGVISGYLGEAGQAASVAALVAAVKNAHPGALYLCDPVIGDGAGLYVPEATAKAIRDTLLPLADIATPNMFELGWLAGRPVATLEDARIAAARLGPARVLVTSAPAGEPAATGRIGTLLCGRESLLCSHAAARHAPNGTGDMLAAAFLGRLLGQAGDAAALADATAAVACAALAADGAARLPLPGDPALDRVAADITLDRLS